MHTCLSASNLGITDPMQWFKLIQECKDEKKYIQKERDSYILTTDRSNKISPQKILHLSHHYLQQISLDDSIEASKEVREILNQWKDRVQKSFYDSTIGKILRWFESGGFCFFYWTEFYVNWTQLDRFLTKRTSDDRDTFPMAAQEEALRYVKRYCGNHLCSPDGSESIERVQALLYQHWDQFHLSDPAFPFLVQSTDSKSVFRWSEYVPSELFPFFERYLERRLADNMKSWSYKHLLQVNIQSVPKNCREPLQKALEKTLKESWWNSKNSRWEIDLHFQVIPPHIVALLRHLKGPKKWSLEVSSPIILADHLLHLPLEENDEVVLKEMGQGHTPLYVQWLKKLKEQGKKLPCFRFENISTDVQRELVASLIQEKIYIPLEGLDCGRIPYPAQELKPGQLGHGKQKPPFSATPQEDAKKIYQTFFSIPSIEKEGLSKYWDSLAFFDPDQACLVSHILWVPKEFEELWIEYFRQRVNKDFFTKQPFSFWQSFPGEDQPFPNVIADFIQARYLEVLHTLSCPAIILDLRDTPRPSPVFLEWIQSAKRPPLHLSFSSEAWKDRKGIEQLKTWIPRAAKITLTIEKEADWGNFLALCPELGQQEILCYVPSFLKSQARFRDTDKIKFQALS